MINYYEPGPGIFYLLSSFSTCLEYILNPFDFDIESSKLPCILYTPAEYI